MSPHYLAQRGTKVTIVEAGSLSDAGPVAAHRLGLRQVVARSRRWRYLWDWRGRKATIRRATPGEVDLWISAVEQADDVRRLTRSALRDRVRGHEQGVLA